MSHTRTLLLAASLAGGLLTTTACETARYGSVELYELRSSPDARITAGALLVPEGGVLMFEAHPRADSTSREYEGLERFELRTVAAGVARARRSILADTWVVNGVSVGSTELHVIIDGDVVDQIPVEVTP